MKISVLVVSLAQCVASYTLLRLRGNPSPVTRSLWLHRSCQMVLRRLGFSRSIRGTPPQVGLLVSNHLSYLDILFYGATLPCFFVAKSEVRSWPLLGLLASLGGTIFIDRRSAASAAEAAVRIQSLLSAGIIVLVFPEGTSSDGSSVLRFYPALFEPAVRAGVPVTAAAIAYSAGPEAEEKDLCYYADISFAPHLFETLQRKKIFTTMRFADPGTIFEDRKQAAKATHQQVARLRASELLPDFH